MSVKSFLKSVAPAQGAQTAKPPGTDLATVPARAAAPTARADRRTDDIEDAIVPCRTRKEFVHEIRYHWERGQRQYIAIGRYLNLAKGTLPHGEFEAMIEADMPFSVETAYKFRALADAVDGKRLTLETLPEHPTVAYEIASMKADVFEKAKAAGLVRKDVKRQELIDFKRSLRPAGTRPRLSANARRKSLLTEYAGLKAEAERIARRMNEVRDELLREHGIADPDNPMGGMTIDVEAERIDG